MPFVLDIVFGYSRLSLAGQRRVWLARLTSREFDPCQECDCTMLSLVKSALLLAALLSYCGVLSPNPTLSTLYSKVLSSDLRNATSSRFPSDPTTTSSSSPSTTNAASSPTQRSTGLKTTQPFHAENATTRIPTTPSLLPNATKTPTASLPTTNGTFANVTQPPINRSLGQCEIYNHSKSAVCSPYIPKDQNVFIANGQSQESMLKSVEALVNIFNQTIGMAGITPICFHEGINFLCNYGFPECRLTNDGLVTWAVLCDEDCEYAFNTGPCSNHLLQMRGAVVLSIGLGKDTLLIDIRKDELNCNQLLTKNQSNSTCREVPSLPTRSAELTTSVSPTNQPKSDLPSIDTPPSGFIRTCGGTAALGSPCHFPFKYNQTEYLNCTTDGSSQPWCATQEGDYDTHRQCGFCNCSDKVFSEQCQTYESGGTCGPYRQGTTVLIDNRLPPLNLLSLLDISASQFKGLVREGEDRVWCVKAFTRTLCHYLFPSCKSFQPGGKVERLHLCSEACYQLLRGNCSSSFLRGMQFLQSVAENLISYSPSYIRLGPPQCDWLPSFADDPDCMDPKLDLGFREIITESPTSTVPQSITPASSSRIVVIAASVAAGTIVVVIVIVIIVIVSKRRKKKIISFVTIFDGSGALIRSKNPIIDDSVDLKNGTLEVRNLRYEPCETSGITMKQALRKESQLGLSIGKAPFDATSVLLSGGKDVAEISTDEIKYIEDLGEGQFGMVFLGELVDKTLVAVKVLKEDADEKNQKEFLKEFSIMSQLQHPNIVSLVAQCTRKTSPIECLVFEFMCYGDLGEFLRKSVLADATVLMEAGRKGGKHQIVKNDLLRIIIQLCEACVYLEDKRFVHRDIATRNCLIGEKLVAKVADFGLSRDVYVSDYYRIGGKALLPVRWMPPESIVYGRFTLKSDVWSFGVLMWEVCTLGKQPYYGKSNEEVVKFVVDAHRLSEPDQLRSASLYSVMKTCWEFEPSARLRFIALLTELQAVKLP